MNTTLKKMTALLAAVTLLGGTSSLSANGSITLSTPDSSGVVAAGGWAQEEGGFRISSEVYLNGGAWHYVYCITSNTAGGEGYEDLSKDLSYFAFQVSEGFTLDEIIIDGTLQGNVSTTLTLQDLEPGKGGASTEGLPGELHAIKVELNENSGTLCMEFDSYRNPILGSFFAKDGRGTYAYNSGLDPLVSSGQFIIVPDTVPIPEPGTWLILSTCLGMAHAARRRKKRA